MNTASNFAKAAAQQAAEMIATLPQQEQQALAELAEAGFRVSVSFVVHPHSQEPGDIQLSAVDDYGMHHVVLTRKIKASQRH